MAAETFGKFRTSINRSIATISVKTSSSLEKTKLRTHIDSLQTEIRKLYKDGGEAAYLRWLSPDTFVGQAPEEIFEQIHAKQQLITELTAELDGIDARDKEILGTQAEKSASLICPKCGAAYESPVKFCRGCGTKMQD